jgi:malic enzyme
MPLTSVSRLMASLSVSLRSPASDSRRSLKRCARSSTRRRRLRGSSTSALPGAGLLPQVENLRAVSATVAVAVANQAVRDGVAQALDDPVQAVQNAMWQAAYRPLEVK